jgi:beta-carotene ketolase (CrtW type)
MAITYNLLKLVFPMWNLILFWEVPAILSTLQLFYFVRILPHRGEHDPQINIKPGVKAKSLDCLFLLLLFWVSS